MSHVRSTDGTTIAYERSGNGPALILVDGALCSRAFGPSAKLAPLLARHFTVYAYDRRGRGQSGDTPPYSPAREVEDIAALIKETGGSASLLGLSSGGALALEAAATGLPIKQGGGLRAALRGRQRSTRRRRARGSTRSVFWRAETAAAAVKYFMKDMVGAPAAHRRPDAADAVDLAQARGRRTYAPVRRRGDDGVQDSAGALRVDPGCRCW